MSDAATADPGPGWAARLLENKRLWRGIVAACAVLLLIYPLISDDLYYQNMIILSLVLAIGAVGLNVIMGFGGYISLGQSAFIGLGEYTVGIATTKIGGDPFVWVPVAGVALRLLFNWYSRPRLTPASTAATPPFLNVASQNSTQLMSSS